MNKFSVDVQCEEVYTDPDPIAWGSGYDPDFERWLDDIKAEEIHDAKN